MKWSFKPYYNWNTFNTKMLVCTNWQSIRVLNLIITGIPSILYTTYTKHYGYISFKPYYNWNTFNTIKENIIINLMEVLNLIITGIPSIHIRSFWGQRWKIVLNLIITGIPSILNICITITQWHLGFKPYYNWNTFNTKIFNFWNMGEGISFKPYYNWNTFNTPPYGPYTSLELSSFKPYYNWNTFNT